MPRASPSHLVFKFACATQHVLDLIPEIDKKQLSDKHRGRLRARIEELTNSLCTSDYPEEDSKFSIGDAAGDAALVSDVRPERNVPAVVTADVESKASAALKTAQAKIQKLEAEVAKMQTEPQLTTVPVNHFRLTRNDDDMDYSYDRLYADYARGATSVEISEPYVERPHQVTNVDAFIRCITSAEPRLTSITLITLPGKTEAVESYLAKIIRTWATKGVAVYVQHDNDAHARFINFSTGLRVRGDRCLDIYRRPEKKGLPRSCLPTEIFIERVRVGQVTSSFAAARDAKPRSDSSKHEQGRKAIQTSPVKRSPVKNVSFAAARDAKPRSDSSKREQGRKEIQTSPVKRSPVKNVSPEKIRKDPSPIDIWRERYRERQAALLRSARENNFFMDADDDMDGQDLSIDRERASMKREHAMALAREHYELLHDGNGMKNEHIWRESQRVAIWDLHIQHLCGERNVGDMQMDGTILYTEPPHTVDDERIIRPADPYVFRVRDEYHQLFIDHYYDGEDYTSAESEQSGELDDSSSE